MKITKKLRDITYEELTNYCRGKIICPECFLRNVRCCTSNDCWVYHKDLYSDKFLDQTIEVEVPDILTKEEKEYLSAVIKPFKDKIDYIQKRISNFGEYIVIMLEGDNALLLPYFKENTMYKGMKKKKEYKLEELGL